MPQGVEHYPRPVILTSFDFLANRSEMPQGVEHREEIEGKAMEFRGEQI